MPTMLDGPALAPAGEAVPPPKLLPMILRFLKIGTIGFGGGMAVIAIIERECVHKHHCIEAEKFIHGVGLGQVLGPFAANTAFFIGYRMHGLLGGVAAETAFLLPSVAMVTALSWLYFTFHRIPALQGVLAGIAPVVIALILSAAWSMGRKALRAPWPVCLAILSCLATWRHLNPVWTLLAAGVAGIVLKMASGGKQAAQKAPPLDSGPTNHSAVSAAPLPAMAATGTAAAKTGGMAAALAGGIAGWTSLAWTFFQVGLMFFGGGFVLIPILHQHLVLDLGWLSDREFLDGTAISQLTPGPIAVLATFAGYKLGGPLGAVVATAALFLPATVLMAWISRYYRKLEGVAVVQQFLAGISAAVTGMIVAAALLLGLGNPQLRHPLPIVLGVASWILLSFLKWPPALILLAGALLGWLMPGSFLG